jgi:hypothetical protein
VVTSVLGKEALVLVKEEVIWAAGLVRMLEKRTLLVPAMTCSMFLLTI